MWVRLPFYSIQFHILCKWRKIVLGRGEPRRWAMSLIENRYVQQEQLVIDQPWFQDAHYLPKWSHSLMILFNRCGEGKTTKFDYLLKHSILRFVLVDNGAGTWLAYCAVFGGHTLSIFFNFWYALRRSVSPKCKCEVVMIYGPTSNGPSISIPILLVVTR